MLPIAAIVERGKDQFVTAFIYPRNDNAVIVKGGEGNVMRYISDHWPVSFAHFVFCRGTRKSITDYRVFGICRNFYCQVNNNEMRQCTNGRVKRRYQIEVYRHNSSSSPIVFEFRRMPRSWISELDEFVDIEGVDSEVESEVDLEDSR